MVRRASAREILRSAAGGSVVPVLALAGAACRLPAPEPRPPLVLVEKGSAQSFFDREGRLLRVLVDVDGDQRADVQFLYRPEGSPRVAEIDTNHDGAVDRWEHFAADGALERVGRSLGSRGRPDVWDYPEAGGRVTRSEFDDDGDGSADRVVRAAGDGQETLIEELDTDGDGKPDRRLRRRADGAILALEIDRDQDGIWERREAVGPR